MGLSRRYFLGGLAALVPAALIGKAVVALPAPMRVVSGIRPWAPATPAQQQYVDEFIYQGDASYVRPGWWKRENGYTFWVCT